MNPFKTTLNRLGYLVWTLGAAAILIGMGLIIDLTKHAHQGNYWLGFRLLIGVLFFFMYFFASIRRLQNAGYSPFLVLVGIIPFVGFFFWLTLLIIPPKNHKT